MGTPPTLVIGSTNVRKAREVADLLASLPVRLVMLADIAEPLQIEENGATLAENAALKAGLHAQHLGRWVVADDTGLFVDALGGAPGVHSARFAGPHADGAANVARLLRELNDVPLADRTATFMCNLALADPSGKLRATGEGRLRGRIQFEPRTDTGFSYNRVFEIVEYRCILADLGAAAKSVLTHRARAAEQLRPEIERLIGSGEL